MLALLALFTHLKLLVLLEIPTLCYLVGLQGSPLVWRHSCVVADFVKVIQNVETLLALLTLLVVLAVLLFEEGSEIKS